MNVMFTRQRWALGEPLPQRLTVTIEAASA